MSQVNSLQQQLKDAEAIVNGLRKQVEEVQQGERKQVIASVMVLIKDHNLTASELGLVRKGPVPKGLNSDKRGVVAAKYVDPASGKTWTGRGKSPKWLAELMAAGRAREEFTIKP